MPAVMGAIKDDHSIPLMCVVLEIVCPEFFELPKTHIGQPSLPGMKGDSLDHVFCFFERNGQAIFSPKAGVHACCCENG